MTTYITTFDKSLGNNWHLEKREPIESTNETNKLGYVLLYNDVKFCNDFPVLGIDGLVKYEFPERIPKYIKKKIQQILSRSARHFADKGELITERKTKCHSLTAD